MDTLGRWKAHHLAELVFAVRDAEGPERAAAEAKLANLLQNFGHRAGKRFSYSEVYDLEMIMPILREILSKN